MYVRVYAQPVDSVLTLRQGQGPYATQLKKTESDIKDVQKRINEKLGTLSLTSRKRSIDGI
jgi:hypothetical protein